MNPPAQPVVQGSCSPRGDREARYAPHHAPQFRDPSSREWLRHTHGAGTPRSPQCFDNHDLHPCPEPGLPWSAESGRHALTCYPAQAVGNPAFNGAPLVHPHLERPLDRHRSTLLGKVLSGKPCRIANRGTNRLAARIKRYRSPFAGFAEPFSGSSVGFHVVSCSRIFTGSIRGVPTAAMLLSGTRRIASWRLAVGELRVRRTNERSRSRSCPGPFGGARFHSRGHQRGGRG